MRLHLIVLTFLIAALPRAASAQTALGLPSFDEGPFIVTAGLGFGEDATSFGGGFVGGTGEIWGGIGVSYSSFDDIDTSAFGVNGTVGTSLALDTRARVWLSPVAGVGFLTGPDIGEIDVDVFGLRGGARLGIVATTGGPVTIVPTFGFDIAYDRVSADLAGVANSEGETFAIARIGAGFLISERFSIVPTVSMPLGRDDSDVIFNIGVGINLGS